MQTSFDTSNIEQSHAFDMIAKTNNSFFLTGRAGTGKTTFINTVQKKIRKKFIVLAPTGIAAINSGGQTIHSFFGFDWGVQGPRSFVNMNLMKRTLVQNIDTIIIDEVSMLRCDLLDAIDRMLRDCTSSSRPFGGIQMVFVGDMFQLPPVVSGEDAQTIELLYGKGAAYFYKARCLKNETLPKIEFRKVYRQSDQAFVELLDRIRTGQVCSFDLKKINERVQKGLVSDNEDDMRITLTSYKDDAKAINDIRLEELAGEPYSFLATYEGTISNQLKEIVDANLILKEGAQVMFLRNDQFRRWANGTIARVISLKEDQIIVQLPDGQLTDVGKQTWDSIEYEYDEKVKKCIKKVVGSVTQYPLRLAWAVTIHKSQSLTFDKVNIDFGRGTFAYGQAYVALSRVRSLEGLRLSSPMGINSVRVSREALQFAYTFNDTQLISTEISIGEAISRYERRGDFDRAATHLFAMCSKEAHEGNIRKAYDLLNRALSSVADDACLFGQKWEPLVNNSKESILLNAAGMLYSGQTDESIRLLTSVVSASKDSFNGLYLLARALEIKKDWDTVEKLYSQMIDVLNDIIDNGLDSPSFRKLKYRVAMLNELQFDRIGFPEIVALIAENPNYDKYHQVLHKMLVRRCDDFENETKDTNPLVAALFDEKVSNKTFLSMVKKERFKKTWIWLKYRKTINSLHLSK